MKFEGKTRVKTKALRFYFRHFNHMTPTQSMGQMRGQLNLFSVTKREKMAFSEGAIVAFPIVIKSYKLLGNSYKTKFVCSLFVGVQYCQIVW